MTASPAHGGAVDHLVERDAAHRHADKVEARHHVLELRGLAAGDRDARHLGARAQAGADGVEHDRVGVRHRDVVDERERLGADADHVIDVHGDAVDADGVVFAQHVGDDGLRADAVGAEREPDAVELDHVGEIADRQDDAAEPGLRPGLLHPRDDVAQARVGLGGIHAALLVEVLAHAALSAACFARCRNRAANYHAAAPARHARKSRRLQRRRPSFLRYHVGNAQDLLGAVARASSPPAQQPRCAPSPHPRCAPLPRSEATWGGVGGGGFSAEDRFDSEERAPTPNPSPQREDALGEGSTPCSLREQSPASSRRRRAHHLRDCCSRPKNSARMAALCAPSAGTAP
jgi:hypothetical protein